MARSTLLLVLYMGVLLADDDPIRVNTTENIIDLSNKTLTNVPKDLPKGISTLILSHNHIVLSELDVEVLSQYQHLKELHLDSNAITSLPAALLSVFPGLEVLNLSHNNISTLAPDAFSGSLTDLDLSYSNIDLLPSGVFKELRGLKRLYLQGNKLNTLGNETGLEPCQLKHLSLEDNPWECSCQFEDLVQWLNGSALLNGTEAKCLTPPNMAGKRILERMCIVVSAKTPTPTKHITETTTSSSTTSSELPRNKNSPHGNDSVSSGGRGGGGSGGLPVVGNTWKFLVGVVVIALSTSMLIVCAVKSPSWYKLLFNYRHKRLREEEEGGNSCNGRGPKGSVMGRFSNFSLDTEQTETSIHDGLDCEMQDMEEEEEDEDEDGFIEDRYIEPGDYRDHNES